MEESVKCQCGNKEFLYFWDRVHCPICLNEYKMTEYIVSKSDYNEVKAEEKWMRKFNHETKEYGHWQKAK